MTRFLLLLATSLTLATSPAVADEAAPDSIGDGTRAERWTLANGLIVTTRHVPGAAFIAVDLGFRVGSNDDPSDRDGLALLAGELLLTAPAGDFPERPRAELDQIRPDGWDLQAGTRTTILSEVVAPAQLPGAVQELAQRMRGLTLTPADLKVAVAATQREMGERYLGAPGRSLYYRAREMAMGGSDETTLRKASAKGLARLTVRDVQERLRSAYVPANAVLSIAGDLSQANLRALAESQFGPIPGGTAMAKAPARPMKPADRFVLRPDVDKPVGILAVIAPEITDEIHTSFLLGVLVLGGLTKDSWGHSDVIASRFRYSVFGDPDLAVFYPSLRTGFSETSEMGAAVDAASNRLQGSIVSPEAYSTLRESMRWQFGGPLSSRQVQRMRVEPGALNTLASAAASRSLWMGEEFWATYLDRLDQELAGAFERVSGYITHPDHQVRLLYRPAK